MAESHSEDTYTRLANDVLEHLARLHLSANQWQVLLCIIRKTCGFHKKVDQIANSQIVAATGLCKAVVSRALKDLHGKGIITRNSKHLGLQADLTKWKITQHPELLAESSTPERDKEPVSSIANAEKLAISSQELAISSQQLAESSTKVSSCAVAQKKKETIQKKLYKRKGCLFFGEMKNVTLTEDEHQKLIGRFGAQGAADRIEELSLAKAAKGYQFKSDYAAILSWDRRKQKGDTRGKTQHSRDLPKEYTPTRAYPDL